MKIGIIGSGVVGRQLGLGFLKLGHQVMVGSRTPTKLSGWKNEAESENASIGTMEEAAEFGEVVVIATLWTGTKEAVERVGGQRLKGKIVIDVTNPMDFSKGAPPIFDATPQKSGAEQVAEWIGEEVKLVKAFNTINAYSMCNPKLEEGAPDLFISGDSKEAKDFVEEIALKWGWGSVVDLGGLNSSYWVECFAMIWINYAFKNNVWSHTFKILHK